MEEEPQDGRGRNLTLGIFAAVVLLIAGLVLRGVIVKQGRIEAMQSADPARQAAAVQAMMEGFTNEGYIAEQFQGERPSVRIAAVRALRALALRPDTPEQTRKDAARLTVPFLKDSDQPIKDLAGQALQDMGPEIALDAATNALGDTDSTVKSGAQTVCQNFAPASIPAILAFTGKDGATARLRTTHRTNAGNALYEISKKKNAAWNTAILFGEQAVRAPAGSVREALQRSLGLDRPLLVPPGIPIFGVVDYLDPTRATEEDQNNAISILDRVGDVRAVPYLIPRVDAPATRRAAVGALGRLADRRATPVLLKYLPVDETNRLEIVIALGKIADPAATDALIREGLGSVSDNVRAAAADSLRSIGLPARDRLITAEQASLSAPRLDPGYYRAEGAVRALAGMRDPTATRAAIAALRYPAENVREAAAATLGDSGDPAAISALIGAFTDPSGRVSGFAARSLSAYGGQAVAPLVSALSDPKRVYWASLAIRYLGQVAVPDLDRKILSGASDPTGARAAAALVGDLGDPRSVAALRQAVAASHDADFQFEAGSSLQRLTGESSSGT